MLKDKHKSPNTLRKVYSDNKLKRTLLTVAIILDDSCELIRCNTPFPHVLSDAFPATKFYYDKTQKATQNEGYTKNKNVNKKKIKNKHT